jgi:hypothetical protein
MIRVHIDVVVRFRPKLLDALGAKPAGVFLFANNKMRDNPDQIDFVGVVAFVQQEPNFTRLNQRTTDFWTKLT